MKASAFVLLQHILPRHWLTTVIWHIARIRHPGIKNVLITQFARAFDVDLEDVKLDVPDDFPTFNDFFIRPSLAAIGVIFSDIIESLIFCSFWQSHMKCTMSSVSWPQS